MRTDERIPEVVAEGVVQLGDLEFKVYTLDNGQRVIEEDSFDKCLALLGISRAQAAQLLEINRSRGEVLPEEFAAIIGDNSEE